MAHKLLTGAVHLRLSNRPAHCVWDAGRGRWEGSICVHLRPINPFGCSATVAMTKRVLVILFLAGVTDFAAAQVNQKKSAAGSTALAPQAITAVAAQPTDDPAASMPAGWSQAAFQLTDATPVRLRLLDNLTSGTEAVGQSVHFQTIEEVRVSNVVIIPKGAPASGVIIATSRNRGGRHATAYPLANAYQVGSQSFPLHRPEPACSPERRLNLIKSE